MGRHSIIVDTAHDRRGPQHTVSFSIVIADAITLADQRSSRRLFAIKDTLVSVIDFCEQSFDVVVECLVRHSVSNHDCTGNSY